MLKEKSKSQTDESHCFPCKSTNFEPFFGQYSIPLVLIDLHRHIFFAKVGHCSLLTDISLSDIGEKDLALKITAMDQEFDQIICKYDRCVHVGLSTNKPHR